MILEFLKIFQEYLSLGVKFLTSCIECQMLETASKKLAEKNILKEN